MPQGSWLMPLGHELGAGSPRPWARAPNFYWPWALSHEPCGMSHGPWAMSHEPLIINNRLIQKLFNSQISKFQISWSTRGGRTLIWSENRDSLRNVHEEGHPTTQSANEHFKDMHFPTQMSFIRSVGLDKKIRGIWWTPPPKKKVLAIQATPRNQYFEVDLVF